MSIDSLKRQTSGPHLPFKPTIRAYPAQLSSVGISGQSVGTSQGTFSASWIVAEPGMRIRPVSPALPFTPTLRGYTAVVGGNVTVSLSGLSVGTSAGSVAPSVFQQVPSSITAAQMGPMLDFAPTIRGYTTPIGNVTVTLSGQSVALSSGTLAPANAAAITGQTIASAPGNVTTAIVARLTGTVSLTSQGTLTTITSGDVSVFLTGQAVTLSAGAVSPLVGFGIIMPNVVGINFYQALEVLQDAGIYIPVPVISFTGSTISVRYTNNSIYPSGFVAAQSVAAGTSVRAGALITLTVETPRFGMVIDMPPDWRQ